MASIEIRFVSTGSRSFSVGNDVSGGTMKLEAIGSGGAGGTGAAFGGGGGKGGSYARRNAQAVSPGDTLNIVVPAGPTTTAGAVATVIRSGVTLLSARGGGVGGNAGALNGGAAGTATVGAFVGDVEFVGGNGRAGQTGSPGSGGSGAGSSVDGNVPTTNNEAGRALGVIQFDETPTGDGGYNNVDPLPYGGAGCGQALTPRGPGAQGIVVLTYSTGIGTISHTAQFNRLLDISRLGLASIAHIAVFNRLVTVRRAGLAAITHVAGQTAKKVRLTRASAITHLARMSKKVGLTRVVSIVHSAVVSKFIRLAPKIAATNHSVVFTRKAVFFRSFFATINHVGRMSKKVRLPRIANITHLANQTTKRVELLRTASITHLARLRRAIEFTRVATITHTAVFSRLVTVRRRFTASIQHRARQLMKLEGRLIPREGGGGVTNYFRNIFLSDD